MVGTFSEGHSLLLSVMLVMKECSECLEVFADSLCVLPLLVIYNLLVFFPESEIGSRTLEVR